MTSRNWAGNIAYSTSLVREPHTVAELQDLVRRSPKLRALGSRHSFNRIADSQGELVSLRQLDRIVAVDTTARHVTIEGGVTYGQLCPVLDAAGLALHNLASLPHISVAGACATATHGSGIGNRNLAAAVVSLDLVTASGDLLTLSQGEPNFDGAVVGLGALGIVARMTLEIRPRFEMRQDVYFDLPVTELLGNFDVIAASAYSVSAFTHWSGEMVAQLWLKSLANAPPPSVSMFGARAATRPSHPIASIDPAPATEQLGVVGPWHERLPHFRMAFTPSVGAELQSEYFVPRSHAAAALGALREVQDRFSPLLLVSEIRTIAADEFWLSPCYRQNCVAFHFTWTPDWPAVSAVLPIIEAQLRRFGARAHWGKLFTMPRDEIQAGYERLADFHQLASVTDPEGKFRNAFLDEYVF